MDDELLLIATGHGFTAAAPDGDGWREVAHGLEGRRVTSVIAREGVILAGTTDGVFRSDDLGRTWREASAGLAVRHVRWLAYHPDISDAEFAGTEPAAIFVSHDGAASWHECPEVATLRDRHGWFLPYSPEAGCVRGFAFYGFRAYAAVEVGGLLRSDDHGETWRLAEGSSGEPHLAGSPAGPLIYPDVHSVEVHPSSPNLIFAPTGDGLYRSDDGGKTWEHLRDDGYCRAVWADPSDPDHLVLGTATSPDRNGRIVETRDGGRTWRAASDGLRVPWPQDMVERFVQVGDKLLAVLAGGGLLAAPLATLEWRRILPGIAEVAAVTTMRD